MANKYKAVRTTIDNIEFASKREAQRYADLKLLERAKKISALTLQPKYTVAINGIHCFNYFADFSYLEDGERVTEDAKGMRTDAYKIKKRCVEAAYGIKIREV